MVHLHDVLGGFVAITTAVGLVATATSGRADEDVAATVIGLERACLDRWGKGDPMGFVEAAAPQITYFDPELQRRCDGIEAFTARMASVKGKVRMDGYELLNPTVEVAGDIAVLSFNYTSWGVTDGKAWRSNWNSTEVYRRLATGWKIVHSHWSRTLQDKVGQPPQGV